MIGRSRAANAQQPQAAGGPIIPSDPKFGFTKPYAAVRKLVRNKQTGLFEKVVDPDRIFQYEPGQTYETLLPTVPLAPGEELVEMPKDQLPWTLQFFTVMSSVLKPTKTPKKPVPFWMM